MRKNQSLSQAFYNGELDIKKAQDRQQMLHQDNEKQSDSLMKLEQSHPEQNHSGQKVIQLYSKAHSENDLKTVINPMLRILTLKSMMLKESIE